MHGSGTLLAAVSQAWTDDGARVRSAAGQIAARLADNAAAALPPAGLDAEALEAAVQALVGEFDAVHGGFGGAPKFPPSMALEFLLRHHERTGSAQALRRSRRRPRGGWPAAACTTSSRGGFARYSVDARWVVPHFEKMLYDNALLLRVYAHLARLAGPAAALARRVAGGDRGVPAAGPAHARGRVRLGAGRRHGRRRGSDLRLDARRS